MNPKRDDMTYMSVVDGVIESCRAGLWKKRLKGCKKGEQGGAQGFICQRFCMPYVNVEVPCVRAEDGIGRRGNVTCQKQHCNLLLMKRTKWVKRGWKKRGR